MQMYVIGVGGGEGIESVCADLAKKRKDRERKKQMAKLKSD